MEERRHNEVVTLKEHIETRLDALDKALNLAEKSMEKRLEGMNAFREQINKIEGTLVTRKELDLILSTILKDHRANIAIFLSALAVCVGIASIFMK